MGLPGTGKSYLARLICERYGFMHLSSDEVRKEIDLRDHYGSSDKQMVYQVMQTKLDAALAEKKSVVVDTTFYQKKIRDEFSKIAGNHHIKPCWILTDASEATVQERLQTERPDSQADYQVYLKIRNHFDHLSVPYLRLLTDEMKDAEMLGKINSHCLLTSE